ncbi:hypothetical protein [Micromonospora antibiotica]|uniref:Uncharacterized protein n=1 Tax=Micromonospora antibiotica TaxID=2807623 RepID=A0ABS3V712_9ACTN|nr:hypothetical protein [Micromonospora antibiotica]MBO4161410.1 hypothetical protein [Micromonospora antibiotica]
MLQHTWYLDDIDWFTTLPDAPRLTDDNSTVIGQLGDLFGGEASFGPATTVTATHVILMALEHLGETMTYAAATHDTTELGRLLCGLNLIQAHLTQIIQHTARQADNRTFRGLTRMPATTVHALTARLTTAGVIGEALAGHLKDAHTVLRTTTP